MVLFHVQQEQEVRDLNFVFRQGQEFDSTFKSYGATIISSTRFQRWLAISTPALIYIEGQLDPSRFGKTSPISYFCANLARLFGDSTTNVTLHFFCGQHVASNNDLKGPRGLIRSLLAQLLQIWPHAPLHGIDLGGFTGSQDSIPMKVLCQIFELLMRQFPISCTIFCIIDDLALFEREAWDEDYWHFLRMLGTLVLGQECGVRFKVLITSSTKSRQLQKALPQDWCIELTERNRMMGQRRQS